MNNRSSLPIFRKRRQILRALSRNQVIVVESPTGSGKTTQLPIILHKSGYTRKGVIGITQPRRIAAVSTSHFISQSLQEKDPSFVAYKMRFEDTTSASTHIKIMTDGTLLQEIRSDPLLLHYSVIIIDEAHERSLTIDFILGLLKRVLRERKDIKIIVSSATLNAEAFSHYFNNCPIVRIEARNYPIETLYLPHSLKEEEETYTTIVKILKKIINDPLSKDVLVFLPGEANLKKCLALIKTQDWGKGILPFLLYARMNSVQQEQVFLPAPKKKVILATNIAETSITIEGIGTVIDSGKMKQTYYDSAKRTTSLVEVTIPQSSCLQRKGRAGRLGPGKCYCLYSEKDFSERPEYMTEEIVRTDLSEVILRMADLDIRDFHSFDFISRPKRENINAAILFLKQLGALEQDNGLSSVGRLMLLFPVLPSHSRIIVEAILSRPQALPSILCIVSFLTTNSALVIPLGKEMEARRAHDSLGHTNGDFAALLSLYHRYVKTKNRVEFCQRYYLDKEILDEILNVKIQLEEICTEQDIPLVSSGSYKNYMMCIAKSLFFSVCRNMGRQRYRSLKNDNIYIHPGSLLKKRNPDYMVAGEVVKTSRTFARSVGVIKEEWLAECDPRLLELTREKKEWERRDNQETRKPRRGKKKHLSIPTSALTDIENHVTHNTSDTLPVLIEKDGRPLVSFDSLSQLININRIIPFQIQEKTPSPDHFNRNNAEDILCLLSACLALAQPTRKSRGGVYGLQKNKQNIYWYRFSSFQQAVGQTRQALSMLKLWIKDAKKKQLEELQEKIQKIQRIC